MPAAFRWAGVNWDDINQGVKNKLRAAVDAITGTPEQSTGPSIREQTPYEKYVQPVSEPALNALRRAAGLAFGETAAEQAQGAALAPLGTSFEIPGLSKLATNPNKPLWKLLKHLGGADYDLVDIAKERLLASAKEGKGLGEGWTTGRQRLADAIGPLGADSAETMAEKYNRGFAAVSPRQSAINNTGEAATLLANYERQQPFTMETLGARGIGNRVSKIPNLRRAYRDATSPLMSDGAPGKVNDLATIMNGGRGNPTDVHWFAGVGAREDAMSQALSSVKQWMLRREGLGTGKTNKLPTGGYGYELSDDDVYRRVSNAGQRFLNETGTTFPDLWEGIRKLKGVWSDDSPYPLLERWGLLEKGAMSDPRNIEAAIGRLRTVNGDPYKWVQGDYGPWVQQGSLWTPHPSLNPLITP